MDLNRERVAEEAKGHIRWLRPDYQNPEGRAALAKGEQAAMSLGPTDTTDKPAFPKSLPDQIAAVRAALDDLGEKASRRMLALAFVLDGRSRTEAAESCGMDRQTLR